MANLKLPYISASQLKTFDSCRFKYMFRYLLKIPDKTSDAQQFGQDVHKACENYFKEGTETDEETLKPYLKLVKENINDEVLETEKRVDFVPRHPLTKKPLSIVLRLVIDAVGKDRLHEIKTTKRSNSWTHEILKTDPQATIYLFYWWQEHKTLPVMQYHILTKLKTPKYNSLVTSRKIEDFVALCETIDKFLNIIKKEQFYPTRNWWCNCCAYKKICKEF